MIKEVLTAAFISMAVTSGVSAATYSFSFDDDPLSLIANRTHLGGSVTGFIFGLEDNTANQTPDAIEFTSDVSGLGMTDTFFDMFTAVFGDGFTVAGGEIVVQVFCLTSMTRQSEGHSFGSIREAVTTT